MVKEVTRHIKKEVERELWARAAGRCQFDGCNMVLYRSPVTQESVNIAEKAHIYSFSEKGPRGWGPFTSNKEGLNSIQNLLLACHGCHKKIDQDKKGQRYSAELLIGWKQAHEQRVEIVTGIQPDKKSHVVFYGANIGAEKSPIDYMGCVQAMFPHWYPAQERPVALSMHSDLKDFTPEYWMAERVHIASVFGRNIAPLIDQDDCKHFSVFALAPQPLLIQLGVLFTDKVSVETYQLHREPKGWAWCEGLDAPKFMVHPPENAGGEPVLLMSLSDHVARDRITRVLGEDVSIWEVTLESPHNDFLKSKAQLSEFRRLLRRLMVEIKQANGNQAPLHIFPVMPVSCAVELGRIRMPKADMPWLIYDQDFKAKEFIKAIEIKGGTDV